MRQFVNMGFAEMNEEILRLETKKIKRKYNNQMVVYFMTFLMIAFLLLAALAANAN